jgi:hypothetical protein
MSFRFPPASVALGLLVLVPACARVQPFPPPTAANTVVVTVNVSCTADSVTFTLSPWTARVDRGGTVEWALNGSAAASAIEIRRKRGVSASDWPFRNGGPYRGGQGNPARAGDMKGNPALNRPRGYEVELTCVSATGESHRVVIDPDIVVN